MKRLCNFLETDLKIKLKKNKKFFPAIKLVHNKEQILIKSIKRLNTR